MNLRVEISNQSMEEKSTRTMETHKVKKEPMIKTADVDLSNGYINRNRPPKIQKGSNFERGMLKLP